MLKYRFWSIARTKSDASILQQDNEPEQRVRDIKSPAADGQTHRPDLSIMLMSVWEHRKRRNKEDRIQENQEEASNKLPVCMYFL